METRKIDPTTIKGWGIDADPKDQPNYPIKHYTGDDHNRKNWQRPSLQEASVEILKSTERPNLSAVFGTPNPPKGLSGIIRRLAFRYSENMLRHWLALMLADRVDVIESSLHKPGEAHWTPSTEIGMEAQARVTRQNVTKVLVVGAIAGLVAYGLYQASKKK